MEKPQGYDEAKSYGDFESLPAGGHKCKIVNVKCEKATNGKDYLKLAIDIAEGKYKDFYKTKFENDTRDPNERKWSGTWTIFIEGYDAGTTNPKFKGLVTSVEASNQGFKFDFDEQKLKDKKVGIVFREEEFEGTDGSIHSVAKPFYAVSYDKAEEAKIPAIKKLTTNNSVPNVNDFDTSSGSDLPF